MPGRRGSLWLRGAVIVISLGLYVEACRRPGADISLGGRPGKVTGLALLCFGWTRGVPGAIPWLSNFLWLAGLVLLARGRLGWAFACSAIGFVLASGVLLPAFPEPLMDAKWWWLSSQAVPVAACGLAWFWMLATGHVITGQSSPSWPNSRPRIEVSLAARRLRDSKLGAIPDPAVSGAKLSHRRSARRHAVRSRSLAPGIPGGFLRPAPVRLAPDASASLKNGHAARPISTSSLLQVLVEPGDGLFLGLIAGFVVDAVVLDVFDRHQFLHAGGPLVGEDGVVLVVEELFEMSVV